MNTMASPLLSTLAALAAGVVAGFSFLAQRATFAAADALLAHLVSAAMPPALPRGALRAAASTA